MQAFRQLYGLYDSYDTTALRNRQDLVDLFPALDSRTSLEQWEAVRDALDRQKSLIRRELPAGDRLAEIGSRATESQAFTALDIYKTYDRGVNALILDVDETLRSASTTDNEIPRETLFFLTELSKKGIPIVICTGQTLENVKGFTIQGLGSELVHSGNVSIVYEAGTGVFTPQHGPDTKQLLYESLDDEIVAVFDDVRSRVLSDAPAELSRRTHLQGNEFNVTLKPNFDIGSSRARTVIDEGLVHLIGLLGEAIAAQTGNDTSHVRRWAAGFYAEQDTEIDSVLQESDSPTDAPSGIPDRVRSLFERIDVAYYEADAAEIGSLELNKVAGVEAALDVLGIDPFALVMGDSKSDLRVMRWLKSESAGICAAPEHASEDVLAFVEETDGLVYAEGKSSEVLRMVYALTELASNPDDVLPPGGRTTDSHPIGDR